MTQVEGKMGEGKQSPTHSYMGTVEVVEGDIRKCGWECEHAVGKHTGEVLVMAGQGCRSRLAAMEEVAAHELCIANL